MPTTDPTPSTPQPFVGGSDDVFVVGVVPRGYRLRLMGWFVVLLVVAVALGLGLLIRYRRR